VTWQDLEVCCDESGSDGENLTGGNTDVFAHASVRLPVDTAAAAIRVIRDRIRSPAEEYKANHLLREKHRAVLEWLLAPPGPLGGKAHVYLVEKAYLVVDRVADLLLGDASGARALFAAGRRSLGDARWGEFLRSANRLLRVRHDGDPAQPVEGFFRTVDDARHTPVPADLAAVLDALAAARPRAEAYRAALVAGPPLVPVLNPLLPAIVRTAAHWSADGHRVRLVHDRQNLLTPERIAWIEETARRRGIRLHGLRLVVSGEDPRVQLADFLAGIARKLASDELNRRADAALTALLRPYVDPDSLWGDEASRAPLIAEVTPPAPSANINSAV
jgi:hypothetical protein